MKERDKLKIRKEYFGALVMNGSENRANIINRWQTRVLELLSRGVKDNLQILRDLERRPLINPMYIGEDDNGTQAMNTERATIDSIDKFILENVRTGVITQSKSVNAEWFDIIHQIDYPKLSGPLGLFVEITNACNLGCEGCYNAGRREKGIESLTYEQILGVIRQFRDLGGREIRISGGEPTIDPNWRDITQFSIDLGLRTTLYTNGFFVDRLNVLDEIAELDLSEIRYTFGGCEIQHNATRRSKGNKDTFSATKDSLEVLLQKRKPIKINFILTKQNRGDVPWLLDYVLKLCGHYGSKIDINITPLKPYGGASHGEWLPGAEDFLYVNNLVEQYRELENVQNSGIHVTINYDLIHTPKQHDPIPLVLANDGCGAGKRGLSVTYDGIVQFCGQMSPEDYIPGVILIIRANPNIATKYGITEESLTHNINVKDSSLETIWYSSKLLEFFQRLYQREQCESCERYTNDCWGICPAIALFHSGDLRKGDKSCFKSLIEINGVK